MKNNKKKKDNRTQFVKVLIQSSFNDEIDYPTFLSLLSGILTACPKLGRRMIYPVINDNEIELSLSAITLLDHDLIDENAKRTLIKATKKSLERYTQANF